MPAYQEVVDDIAQKIEKGELKPSDQLPSIARLAEQYDTSQTTIKTALLILRQRGLVRGRQGKGVYVSQPKTNP